jgi:hypothetical protein
MKNKFQLFHFGILMLIVLFAYMGCGKEETTIGPSSGGNGSNPPTYTVVVIVLGPSGAPQGGATVTLQNMPYVSSIFSGITDSSGRATIQSPSGYQTIVVSMGTVFTATITVTVQATSATQVTTPVKLTQNTTLGKTLVIFAGCEQIESVLTDPSIAFTAFDTASIDYMRARVVKDSTALLNFFKQYAIIFSDCNCGDEYGYAKLARCYGRYVQQGGKIYGGHYNYYNLQFIFPPYYQKSTSGGPYSYPDTLLVTNTNLQVALGSNIVTWTGSLLSYTAWSDLPASSSTTIYGVKKTSPGSPSSPQGIPIIIENRLGTGKYVWTTYHNQDILSDTRLIKIVRYFLYNM